MTIAATDFISNGMNPEQASQLASQMNGSADAGALVRYGFSVPLANELAAQITATTGNISNLMALGVPGALAKKISDDIDTL